MRADTDQGLATRCDREGAAVANSSASAVDHFFRHEAGRLVSRLVRLFGAHHLTLAQDVVQEALLRALRIWSVGGLPDNPAAWISRVARNLAVDAVRHQRLVLAKEADVITHLDQLSDRTDTEPQAAEWRDDQFRLMFVCCHPVVPCQGQVMLALKLLCGFGTAEIAAAFLSTPAAVEKQLTRAKKRIREANVTFALPSAEEFPARMEGVLETIYLLFNEGYKASGGGRLVQEELCQEAVRLGVLLVEHPAGNTPQTHALLALMLCCAARLPARLDSAGNLLALDQQDRSKWRRPMIERGLWHLAESAQGGVFSDFHLQAGVSACHVLAPDYSSTDWPRILQLYDLMAERNRSPIIALNRAVAVAQVHGPKAGLVALEAIQHDGRFDGYHLYHATLGELRWRMGEHGAAAESYRMAVSLASAKQERTFLAKKLQGSLRPQPMGATSEFLPVN